MWLIILGLVLVAAIGGAIYLTFAVAKFGAVKKLSQDKKWLKLLISFGMIAVCFASITIAMSLVNAVIVLLHFIIFFLLFGLLVRISVKIAKKKPKINLHGWLALTTTIVYLCVAYFLCNNIWQTDYAITTDKQVGTLKVAMFADSHICNTFDGDGFKERLDEIIKQSPDILLIPGDFVDDDTDRESMIKACEALGKTDFKYGVWFAYGNHDKGYYGSEHRGFSAQELEDEMKKNNVHILQDEYELIDDRFYIVGRKDKSDKNRKDAVELTEKLDTSKYIIVMDHQPADYSREAESNADLVVSGHTHGGQFFPVTHVGEWFNINDRTYGYEKRNNTEFIVTSGISCWAIRFKTGTKSEFVMIDINQQ